MGTQFRRWATKILKNHLLHGQTLIQRINVIEDRLDRRLAKTESEIADLKDKVDFFVQTQTPPLQGVFYEGQLWDACSLVEKLIERAKKTVVLIDSWVGPTTLDMLAKKRKGVKVEVVTSPRGNKLAQSDIEKFNAQYGGLSVKTSAAFHDRFLIIDDKELYLIGASLKDLGRKCFGFTALDKSNIPDIFAKI
jgi:sugar-specific transcriptional regulator TrmB